MNTGRDSQTAIARQCEPMIKKPFSIDNLLGVDRTEPTTDIHNHGHDNHHVESAQDLHIPHIKDEQLEEGEESGSLENLSKLIIAAKISQKHFEL